MRKGFDRMEQNQYNKEVEAEVGKKAEQTDEFTEKIKTNGEPTQSKKKKKEKRELTAAEKHKRTKRNIIIGFLSCVLILLLSLTLPALIDAIRGEEERPKATPVDPSKLYETKEEDFDIFEYEEYLKFDRKFYLEDNKMNTVESIEDPTEAAYGEAIVLLYDLFHFIMEGDVDGYNALVVETLQKDDFTQQQIYDVKFTKKTEAANGVNTEYEVQVTYKIHENNGTFNNTIEPDACRPQIFVLNDNSGTLLVVDIIDVLPAENE